MVAFHKAGLSPTLFQIDKAFENHPNYVGIRRVLDNITPATAEVTTHFAKNVKGLSDRRKAIKRAYELYLDLHDLTTPLPSDKLQPVMAGRLNG